MTFRRSSSTSSPDTRPVASESTADRSSVSVSGRYCRQAPYSSRVLLVRETRGAGARGRRPAPDGVERVDPELAGGARPAASAHARANTPGWRLATIVSAGLGVERLLVVAPREVERPAGDDVREQVGLRRRAAARSSRTGRRSPPATAAGRATGSRCARCACGRSARRPARRAAVVDEPLHLADELPLRPDVHERVGAHREAERAARERHRRVAVAADRLAARAR